MVTKSELAQLTTTKFDDPYINVDHALPADFTDEVRDRLRIERGDGCSSFAGAGVGRIAFEQYPTTDDARGHTIDAAQHVVDRRAQGFDVGNADGYRHSVLPSIGEP
ncbi:MAG: hypothetical protein EBT81_05680 [Gammaproteobacteria bacterium]|nr:hypothetical protein [Gammaproteobacteria bacterium]